MYQILTHSEFWLQTVRQTDRRNFKLRVRYKYKEQANIDKHTISIPPWHTSQSDVLRP